MPRSAWLAVGAVAAAWALTGPLGESPWPSVVAMVAGAVGAAAWLVLRLEAPSQRSRVGRLGLSTALGVLLIAGRIVAVPPPPVATFSGALPSGDGPWTGIVETVSAPKGATRSAVVVFETPTGLRLVATLPVFPPVVPGDRVELTGSLQPPGDGDYGTYLARIGATATLRARSLTILPQRGDLGRTLEGIRRAADAGLRLAIPEPEAGLASGVLIGLRDRVDRDLTAAFTAVGATHVVAISGWNIAIVAATLAALAGRLARRRRAVLTTVAIVAYVVFVGPSASVLRAAGMAGVVLLARELGRPSTAAAAIGWAVATLLAIDPAMVGDAGFQLSSLATAGLIAWGTPLGNRLAGPNPGRVRAWLAESLGVSLAAQAVTLPVILASFGRLSLVSPVVNLGVVPLVAPAMGAGVLAMIGGLIGTAGLPGIAIIAGLPAWVLFGAIVGLVRVGASLPFASVTLDPPWDLAGGAIAAAVLAVVAFRARKPSAHTPASTAKQTSTAKPAPAPKPASQRRVVAPDWIRGRHGRLLVALVATAVVATGVVAIHRPDGVPRVIVLDVGQGDAILVEGGRGGRMLVDGGPDPGRLLIALGERLPPWDRRIDIVVLTHPHEDHAAGLAALIAAFRVGQVLEPGMIGPGPGYRALEAALSGSSIPHGVLVAGDHLRLDEFVFRVLWPDPDTVPERPADGGTAINNVSIVLLGEVGRHRLLLAGDIEQGIDPTLVARGLPSVDLLKVAHHGSRTASTAALLSAVRPGIAIISAGAGNPYGHPAPSTIERLLTAGARVLRTDRDGSVEVELGDGPLRVQTSGGRTVAAAIATVGGAASDRRISGAAGVPFLCGIVPPARPPVATAAVAVAPVVARTPGGGWSFAAPPAPGRPVGYDATRDRPDPSRSRRVLLGRRQLRAGRCRGGIRRRRRPLPGRHSRALACSP